MTTSHFPNPASATARDLHSLAMAIRNFIVAGEVISDESVKRTYETDGFTARSAMPLLVVLPANRDEVVALMRYCHKHGLPIVPRGAGTSLSGGAVPIENGIVLGMGKFKKILEIDYENRLARVEPGVTNLAISQAVAGRQFYYAPDPSSQIACTIGGNVAENSGGVHCLKYGMTSNNILAIELVTLEGDVVTIGGGKCLDGPGYDLMGVISGSEGLLGVITEVTVKILPQPPQAQAVLIGFDEVEQASDCVASIIAAGIIPAGLEMMDNPAIIAAEAYVRVGYPTQAAAILICELDGENEEIASLLERVTLIAQSHHASLLRISQSEAERLQFWAGRKAAFPAVGQISPDYLCMDGTIPRQKIAEVLREMQKLSASYNLKVANVFHAGDGNLHPLILYDANKSGEQEKAEEFGADILRLCVKVGGVLTGEHGVGIEKKDLMPSMFSQTDLAVQQRLKCAFDSEGLMNPGKVFPELHRCAELGRMHVHKGKLAFPELPRF